MTKRQQQLVFLPTIMESLLSRNPTAEEELFRRELGGDLSELLVDRWQTLSAREKLKRRGLSSSQALKERKSLGDRLSQLSSIFFQSESEKRRQRKRIVKHELDRALEQGAQYTPSEFVVKDRALLYEVARKIHAKLDPCNCRRPGSTAHGPADVTKFGVKVSKILCRDQSETGRDEIYLMVATADGDGHVQTQVSQCFRIDDDDHDVVYPQFWLYPPKDPHGFLDLGVSLWEDDGGYDTVAKHIGGIGGALSKVEYAKEAGVGVQIVGEIVGLLGLFDNDDLFGQQSITYHSTDELAAAVGEQVMNFFDVDEGWFDDGYDFDLTFEVISP